MALEGPRSGRAGVSELTQRRPSTASTAPLSALVAITPKPWPAGHPFGYSRVYYTTPPSPSSFVSIQRPLQRLKLRPNRAHLLSFVRQSSRSSPSQGPHGVSSVRHGSLEDSVNGTSSFW